jgi:hypothetical protein
MKRHQAFWALCGTMLFLVAGTAWAADRPALSDNAPAILASLGPDGVVILDDQEAMAIRGQGGTYAYVLVKILGLNAMDFGPGVQWTWNPLGYRYGAFGGAGWSNTGSDPADAMDVLFRTHDAAYESPDFNLRLAADAALLAGLKALPNGGSIYWGLIYTGQDIIADFWPAGKNVWVSGVSFFGNKLFFGWRQMPYTEYARREALAAMGVMIFGKSLISSIRLQ